MFKANRRLDGDGMYAFCESVVWVSCRGKATRPETATLYSIDNDDMVGIVLNVLWARHGHCVRRSERCRYTYHCSHLDSG